MSSRINIRVRFAEPKFVVRDVVLGEPVNQRFALTRDDESDVAVASRHVPRGIEDDVMSARLSELSSPSHRATAEHLRSSVPGGVIRTARRPHQCISSWFNNSFKMRSPVANIATCRFGFWDRSAADTWKGTAIPSSVRISFTLWRQRQKSVGMLSTRRAGWPGRIAGAESFTAMFQHEHIVDEEIITAVQRVQ